MKYVEWKAYLIDDFSGHYVVLDFFGRNMKTVAPDHTSVAVVDGSIGWQFPGTGVHGHWIFVSFISYQRPRIVPTCFSFLHFLALAALAAFFRFWPILAFWPWILEDKQAQSPVIIECVLSRPVHNIFKADTYGNICDEISSRS